MTVSHIFQPASLLTKLAHKTNCIEETSQTSSMGVLDLLRDFARQGQITKTVLNIAVPSPEIGCTFCNKNLRCETSEQSTDMETKQSVQTQNFDDYDSNDGGKTKRLGDTSRGEVSPSDASLAEDEQEEEAEMSKFGELDDYSKNEFVNDPKVVDFVNLDSDSKIDMENNSSTNNLKTTPTISETTFVTTGG